MAPQIFQLTRALSVTLVMVALTMPLNSCSSLPGDSDGRQYLEAKGNEEKLFKVNSFTKTKTWGDETHYAIQYEAELECLKSNAPVPGAFPRMAQPFGIDVDCARAGQIVKHEGTLQFAKTQKGWVVVPDVSN
jgi:hypothetical protein